mmetsp:Transcript_49586/g.120308  ORF Transcript_49586/g.120308 Transcript_49586/m.120308 type:complete len:185 (+) Transcript_49586:475-1029(+)
MEKLCDTVAVLESEVKDLKSTANNNSTATTTTKQHDTGPNVDDYVHHIPTFRCHYETSEVCLSMYGVDAQYVFRQVLQEKLSPEGTEALFDGQALFLDRGYDNLILFQKGSPFDCVARETVHDCHRVESDDVVLPEGNHASREYAHGLLDGTTRFEVVNKKVATISLFTVDEAYINKKNLTSRR